MTNNFQPIDNGPAGEDSLVDRLRRDAQQPGPWSHRFKNLIEAITAVEHETGDAPLCKDCQSILDIYVDDERAGVDVAQTYPAVWEHLQTCANCQRDHELVLNSLSDDGAAANAPDTPTPPLAFLKPAPANAPWFSRLRSQIAGRAFGLDISLNLAYLREWLSPSRPHPVMRSGESTARPSERRLLLSDSVSVGGQQILVEVKAAMPADRPDQLTLYASLIDSDLLPQDLWVKVSWAGETYRAKVDPQGNAEVTGVPLAQLQAALKAGRGPFEIAFEVHEP